MVKTKFACVVNLVRTKIRFSFYEFSLYFYKWTKSDARKRRGARVVTLIVPCYNEEFRLNFSAFDQALAEDKNLFFLFVDDGSKDQTCELLRGHFAGNLQVEVLKLTKNVGKAEAIRQGMLHLIQKKSQSDWWGFWDADLATPLFEVGQMLKYQANFHPKARTIFGSRVYRLGAEIKRSALRHYLGRGFATIISHALQIEAYDTQCGAKLLRPEIALIVFKEPFISPWIFDVEILLRLQQSEVVEYPLGVWRDVAGSKLNITRELFRVLFHIWKIRQRYLKTGSF